MEHSREYRNGNTLRDYQLEGVNWLLFNWYNRSVLDNEFMLHLDAFADLVTWNIYEICMVRFNVIIFLPSPGIGFGKPIYSCDKFNTQEQSIRTITLPLCVCSLYLFGRKSDFLPSWTPLQNKYFFFSFDPRKPVCFTTRVHCVSVLILTLGDVLMCEHAQFVYSKPTQRFSWKVLWRAA